MSMYTARTPVRRKRTDPVTMVLIAVGVLGIPLMGAAVYWVLNKKPPEPVKKAAKPVVAAKPVETKPQPKPQPKKEEPTEPVSDLPERITNAGDAVDYLAATVKLGLDVNPDHRALIVWLVDSSSSAGQLRRDVASRVQSMYDTLARATAETSGSKEPASPDEAPVLSVVGSFAAGFSVVTAEPTADASAVSQAIEDVKDDAGPVENTFAAVKQATEKFIDYRRQKNRYMAIVVVTDEVGDDQAVVDQAIPQLELFAVPVYVIGPSALFGRTNNQSGMMRSSNAGDAAGGDTVVVQGPESRDVEWIQLAYPMGGGGEMDSNIDTGLGPFSLAKLCQRTQGAYLAYPAAGSFGGGGYDYSSNSGFGDWGGSIRSRTGSRSATSSAGESPLAKYRPNYVDEAEYHAQVAKSKARQALVAAAKLKAAEVPTVYDQVFSNDDEVKRVRAIETAQKPVARVRPGIDAFYDALKPGEADAATLTEPRLKAGYFLAFGRACAAKARADGYIEMLGKMKGGAKFTDPKSTQWFLERVDDPTGISAVDNMAKKARTYLQMVQDEFPGTPWAKSAQRELQSQIGWKWIER